MFGLFFFIALTVFLLVKLNEILGTRAGFYIDKENLHSMTEKSTVEEVTKSKEDEKLAEVIKVYPTFNAESFLNKARKAFEIIFAAYAKGDTKTLKGLLSSRIFNAFSMAIEDRKKRGEVLEGIFVRFISSEIVDVSTAENEVFITVKFETEQSNVLKSEDGTILEGSADFVENRTEIWSFVRKKNANDFKWYLHEIKSD